MKTLALSCAAALATLPAALAGQTVAIAPHIGTLGVGVDGAVAVSEVVSLRGGINLQPFSPEGDFDDNAFTIDLPSPSLTALVDLHPGGSAFRFSAGIVYFGSDIELDAVLDEPIDIGNGVYQPSEVGTLTGTLMTNALAPYLGIGVGNAARGGTGFFLDAGVAFHGTPEVELSASGSIASDPTFQSNLAMEETEIEDDASSVKVYPVLSLGFRLTVR